MGEIQLESILPKEASPTLARLLFGRDQRIDAPNVFLGHGQRTNQECVFRRFAAGWDGCCAEGGEADVVMVA